MLKILLGVALTLSPLFGQEQKAEKKFLVRAEKVQRGNIAMYIYIYGRLTGLEEAPVIPPVPGRVVSILKKEGDRVSKDEVIALLDREIPGVKTEYVQVKSPINGIITLINGKVGMYALQTQPFAYVISDSLVVEVNLASSDLDKVKVGARCLVSDGEKSFEGVLITKSYGVDPMSFTGKAKIQISPGTTLQVGSIVRVKIPVKESRGVLIVPESALVEKGEKTVVYIVQNGVAKEVPVTVGIVSENRAEIRGELKEGDLVVTLGAQGLYDGAPVEVGGY